MRRAVVVLSLGSSAAACLGACVLLLGQEDLVEERASGDRDVVQPHSDGEAIADARVDGDGPSVLVDGGDVQETGCQGPACERLVFVSSTSASGDLGGLAGADARCQALARGSPLPAVNTRQFVAWLSSNEVAARDRLVHGVAAYKRVDGAIIAADWTEFASTVHRVRLVLDEAGRPIGDSLVWTGTTADGAVAVGTCDNWTRSVFADGRYGQTSTLDFRWTDSSAQVCDQSARIYCVQR